MKILFLSAASSIHTVKWVNALAKRGHEVHLVFNEGHNPKENLIDDKVILHAMKYSGGKAYYLNARQLRKIKKKIQPDVINAHYASGYGTLVRKARIGPVLLSVWGSDVYDFPRRNIINKKILEKNVKYAKRIASTSKCMAEELKRILQMPDVKIEITPFGVDLNRFKVRIEKKEDNNQILLGNIKALEQVYGNDDFIKAISVLKKDLEQSGNIQLAESIKTEIYGEGSQKLALEELIKNLSLDQSVHLKGRIPNTDVPEVLSGFDVFCATSLNESFGVSVIEAMAMKVPVVVSDADGFKEVVIDSESGYIVPKSDINSIAEKLKRLILDKELRKTMGENGRKRVESLYNWEDNVTTMERIYQAMLEE